MRSVVGVDGCGEGWATVRHSEDGALEVKVIESLRELAPLPDAIAIDIPIGLTDSGPRECDVLARGMIGPRGSSVFPAPVRAVLECEDYELANARSREVQDKGITRQTFAIVPKIRSVEDALLNSERLLECVFEVHPEVSFAAWNGSPLEHPKRSGEGAALRKGLVASFFGRFAFEFAREFLPKSVADDDILDAFAATWTAWRIAAGIAESLPTAPRRDSKGLKMAIWY